MSQISPEQNLPLCRWIVPSASLPHPQSAWMSCAGLGTGQCRSTHGHHTGPWSRPDGPQSSGTLHLGITLTNPPLPIQLISTINHYTYTDHTNALPCYSDTYSFSIDFTSIDVSIPSSVSKSWSVQTKLVKENWIVIHHAFAVLWEVWNVCLVSKVRWL